MGRFHFDTISFPVKSLSPILLCTTLFLSACEKGQVPSASTENAVRGIYNASLSDDGSFSIIGSIEHGGSLWRVKDRERLFDWNHRKGEFSAVIASGFSPDGEFALTADHQTMVLWETSTGSPLTFWTAPSEILALDLSPNGNTALLGLEDFSAVIFDVKRGGILSTFYHKDRVRSVAFSNDGKFALTGSEDGFANLWDLSSKEKIHSWNHNDEVHTVAISPVGDKAFSVAKYDKAALWDTSSGELIGEIPLSNTAIKRGTVFTAAVFSADGERLLTGTADRLVQLWDTNTLKEVSRWLMPKRDAWKPTSSSVLALAFSENEQYYVVTSDGFTHELR